MLGSRTVMLGTEWEVIIGPRIGGKLETKIKMPAMRAQKTVFASRSARGLLSPLIVLAKGFYGLGYFVVFGG